MKNKIYYVYIITNKRNTVFYTGMTNNLERRIYEHKNKLVKGFSFKYNVDRLVYYEVFYNPEEAILAEKKIKGGSREKKLNLVKSVNPKFLDLLGESRWSTGLLCRSLRSLLAMTPSSNKGFSLFELLLVIAIIAIIATVGSGYYRNYVKSVEFDSAAKGIVFDLKNAQAKAMAGEDNVKWGVHFVNGSSDYYELFSTPTDYSDPLKSVKSAAYLPGSVIFTNPVESGNSNIIFSKINGTSTASSVTISFEGSVKIINVTAVGNIY